jgi:hypothetical protein
LIADLVDPFFGKRHEVVLVIFAEICLDEQIRAPLPRPPKGLMASPALYFGGVSGS